jgi:hypothetical protein
MRLPDWAETVAQAERCGLQSFEYAMPNPTHVTVHVYVSSSHILTILARYVHQKYALRLRIVQHAGTRRQDLEGWRLERERIRCLPIPVVTAPQHARS